MAPSSIVPPPATPSPAGPATSPDDLDALARAAQQGNADALERLVGAIRNRMYRLALRMVTLPTEAEDATQEILIRIVTRLSTFEGRSRFTTWAYRVAVNHLLDRKRSMAERAELDFDKFGEDLSEGLSPSIAARSSSLTSSPDRNMLVTEVRLGCTLALLTCLDRDHRVAYILGEILGLSSSDASTICDVAEATYRKRLSRARTRVKDFTAAHCGLVSPNAAECRCDRRVDRARELGRIDPANLQYAAHAVERATEELTSFHNATSLMRSHPDYAAPASVTDGVRKLIQSGRLTVLQ